MSVIVRPTYSEGTYPLSLDGYVDRVEVERERWRGPFGDRIEVRAAWEESDEQRIERVSKRVLGGTAAERTSDGEIGIVL